MLPKPLTGSAALSAMAMSAWNGSGKTRVWRVSGKIQTSSGSLTLFKRARNSGQGSKQTLLVLESDLERRLSGRSSRQFPPVRKLHGTRPQFRTPKKTLAFILREKDVPPAWRHSPLRRCHDSANTTLGSGAGFVGSLRMLASTRYFTASP